MVINEFVAVVEPGIKETEVVQSGNLVAKSIEKFAIVHKFRADIGACVVVVGIVAGNSPEVGGFVGANGLKGHNIGKGLIWKYAVVVILHSLGPTSGAPGTVGAGGVGGMFNFFPRFDDGTTVALEDDHIGKGFFEIIEEWGLNDSHCLISQ